jgi:ribosomal protein S18 acetylase RimI-like enzyme
MAEGFDVIRTSHCSIDMVSESDLDAVLDVYRGCVDFLAFGPEPTASMRMVQSDLELSKTEGGTYCGIRDAAGRMIGVVDFVANDFEGIQDHGFLSLLIISASHRGMGIGTEVVAAVERKMVRECGVRTILSAVQTNNQRAIEFWQKMGFSVASEPQPQLDGTVTYRLRKDLSAPG